MYLLTYLSPISEKKYVVPCIPGDTALKVDSDQWIQTSSSTEPIFSNKCSSYYFIYWDSRKQTTMNIIQNLLAGKAGLRASFFVWHLSCHNCTRQILLWESQKYNSWWMPIHNNTCIHPYMQQLHFYDRFKSQQCVFYTHKKHSRHHMLLHNSCE